MVRKNVLLGVSLTLLHDRDREKSPSGNCHVAESGQNRLMNDDGRRMRVREMGLKRRGRSIDLLYGAAANSHEVNVVSKKEAKKEWECILQKRKSLMICFATLVALHTPLPPSRMNSLGVWRI